MRLALHWQIGIAIVLAFVVGALTWSMPDGQQATLVGVFQFVGALFINALKMLIVPLIVSSIIVGVANIGGGDDVGRLGGKTLLFYWATTLSAILVGLFLVNIVQPGLSNGEPARDLLDLTVSAGEVSSRVGSPGMGDLADIFLRLVPSNVVAAAANAQLLGLIFFSLLFGYFMARASHDVAEPLFRFWNGVFDVMMRMTEFVMKFAPIGVFGLIAAVVASQDYSEFERFLGVLLKFAGVVAAALLIQLLVVLPLFLRFAGRVRAYAMFPAMAPALLTAFSTASSSATLPITMDCVEDNAGVSKKIASFVLPLGATVNMAGTALYECVAVIFIAQAYGVDLSIYLQFVIVMTALLTSIGVAGVPSASLVAIVIILQTVGLPAEAIGILFVFDRILDMSRTAVNIFGDACCAVIVARREGETTALALDAPSAPSAA
ncbi:MAG: dicarboxylate/amino acid:cation symporter [Pseudomonadota bacterium]